MQRHFLKNDFTGFFLSRHAAASVTGQLLNGFIHVNNELTVSCRIVTSISTQKIITIE